MRRTLVSVANRDGTIESYRGLVQLGFEIISTGGTLNKLQEVETAAIATDDVTGFPEILDGRVKTLHPKVHGGLLFRGDLPEHVATVQEHDIQPIDLVCANLYELEKVSKAGKSMGNVIESTDIGGPSMIRSAAKNFKDVLIVTDPAGYPSILDVLQEKTDDENFRLSLAYKAFSTTGAYDAMIPRYFAGVVGDGFPDILNISLEKSEHLRYGKNSQQRADAYADEFVQESLLDYEQLNGKEISFSNVNNLYGAIVVVREFGDQIVIAAIRHSTPCGVAIAETGYESCTKAYKVDP